MKIEYKVIVLSIIFALFGWITDAFVDYSIFYEGSFGDLLFYNIPPHELYMRSLMAALIFVFSLLMSKVIAGRRRAEEKLKEAKDHLDNIIESSLDSINVTDSTGKITRVNKTFLKLLDFKEEEIIGKYTYDLAPAEVGTYESTTGELVEINEDFFNDAKTVAPKLFEEGKIEYRDTYLVSKDRKVVPVEGNIALLYNKKGDVIGGVGVIRDVTERRRAEREREKIIQELQDALANVKKLSGLLPICGSCKSVRDDSGYWTRIEKYIRDHSEADFSHSICPECMKRRYPEF
jgi:PAS domain-containing protein